MSDGRRGVYFALGRIARQAGSNSTLPLSADSASDPAAPGEATLLIALPWSDDGPWTSAAMLRVASDDGSHEVIVTAADAIVRGSHRLFTLAGLRPGLIYQGAMHDGEAIDALFGPVALATMLDAAALDAAALDAARHLPPPPPDPDAPALGEEGGDLADFVYDEPDSQGALDAHPVDPEVFP